jgi:hypothetical protein
VSDLVPSARPDPPAAVRGGDADLSALARHINAEHEAGERATRKGLEHFRAAGDALIRAKQQCGHGKWLKWLRANVRFSQPTAWSYMRLASGWDKLSAADNLREALRLLSGGSEGPGTSGGAPGADGGRKAQPTRLVLVAENGEEEDLGEVRASGAGHSALYAIARRWPEELEKELASHRRVEALFEEFRKLEPDQRVEFLHEWRRMSPTSFPDDAHFRELLYRWGGGGQVP